MPNHCRGCHGHVYDERDPLCCDEHSPADGKDCPGCQECERLRKEKSEIASQCLITVQSWKDRLTAEVGLKEEECAQLRTRLAKAERFCEYFGPAGDGMGIQIRKEALWDCWDVAREFFAAWERENG